MKKIILISASILSLLTLAPINAQSDSEQVFQQAKTEIQELNFSSSEFTDFTDFNKIAKVIEIATKNIETIESSSEDEPAKLDWIKELEKEALLQIKNLLDNPVKDVETVNNTDEVSREAKNALGTAESYLNYSSFSKQGLYDQLLYEQYPEDAAQYAVDNIQTDWNENALGTAKSYLEYSSFSDAGLFDQLIYEGFTDEQAQYAIDNLD